MHNTFIIIFPLSGSSGPMSLQSTHSHTAAATTVVHAAAAPQALTTQTLPSLETNLHKILARKIQDSEEMTFRKAKLLTKAYYRLLRRESAAAPLVVVDPQTQVRKHSTTAKYFLKNFISFT